MRSIYCLIIMSGLVMISACATPETRVRSGLMKAGLSQPMATCMADRMVDRLSLGQLNKLSGLGKLNDKEAGDISLNEFVKRTKALRDPEILGVVSSSSVVCAIK